MTKWKYTVWKFKHDAASHMVWNAIWAFKHLSKKFLASCHWASYLALLNDLLCGGEAGKISYREEKLFEYVLHSWNKAEKIRISETENFPPDNKIYR